MFDALACAKIKISNYFEKTTKSLSSDLSVLIDLSVWVCFERCDTADKNWRECVYGSIFKSGFFKKNSRS